MLHEKITRPPPPRDDRPTEDEKEVQGLATQIMDALEYGVILWSRSGQCDMFNRQILDCMELQPDQLKRQTTLSEFMAMCCARGDFSKPDLQDLLGKFTTGHPFRYDSVLPSGRVISANVRPVRDGGFVVAFSDMTEERNAMRALDIARADAEEAQRRATEVLNDERSRQRESVRLAKLDEWLQSCKSLKELYEIVTAFMNQVLPATRGQLFIYSNSRDILELACSWNTSVHQDHVTADSCWALRRGRKYIYEPDEFCFLCDHVIEANAGNRSPVRYLCVPIVAHGDTVGMLHLEFMNNRENPDVLDVVRFAARSGEHISMAIANVKLRDELQDQSTRDPLTGLYNRRYFLDALRREINRAAGQQSNLALIALDADKFKNFNDEHGHDAGDSVLEAISERMRQIDHPGTIACRIGGEEFSIILPNADRTRASTIAEDLRGAIAETKVKYMGGALPKVTISGGIAIYPTHGTQPQDLIKLSDTALYAAKKAGRNCWRVAEGDGMISFF